MDGLNNLVSVVRPGDWLFTLDDVARYHHVPVMEKFRKYLGFEWDGVYYE